MQEKTVESKYALEAPTYRCAACAEEIPAGSAYLSAIVFEAEAFLRREFCASCRDRGRFSAEAAFAYWKTRRPVPPSPPPRRRRFDVDLIWTFFERLSKDLDAGPPAAEKTRLCFLLALLLVRSKRLVLEGTAVQNGREWLRLSRKGEPETAYRVENPDLAESDLERVKDELGVMLQMQL